MNSKETFVIFWTLINVISSKDLAKISLNLEPSDASWLAYLTNEEPTKDLIPMNTFAPDNVCDPHDTNFKGCHAVLIRKDLAVTNRACLGRQQSRKNDLWIAQGMLDKDKFEAYGAVRKVHSSVFFPPPKECHTGKEGPECMRNIVLLRFDEIPNVKPIDIPAAQMSIDDKRIKCRVFGWGVWGNGTNSTSPYQAFSTPAKLVDEMFCNDALGSGSVMRKNDLCYKNGKTKVCSMNAEGAPVVCNVGTGDMLVGLQRKRMYKSRKNGTIDAPYPLLVNNVPAHDFNGDQEFAGGKYEEPYQQINIQEAFGARSENNTAAQILFSNLLMTISLFLIE